MLGCNYQHAHNHIAFTVNKLLDHQKESMPTSDTQCRWVLPWDSPPPHLTSRPGDTSSLGYNWYKSTLQKILKAGGIFCRVDLYLHIPVKERWAVFPGLEVSWGGGSHSNLLLVLHINQLIVCMWIITTDHSRSQFHKSKSLWSNLLGFSKLEVGR